MASHGNALIDGNNRLIPTYGAVQVLASKTGIDALDLNHNTNVYDVPGGYEANLIAMVIRPTTVTNYLAAPAIEIQTGGGQNVWGPATLTPLNSSAKTFTIPLSGVSVYASGGGSFNIIISTAATADVFTFTADVIGYLI